MTLHSARRIAVDKQFLTTAAAHVGIAAGAAAFAGAALCGATALFLNEALNAGSGASGPSGSGTQFAEQLWRVFLLLTSLPFSGQLRAGLETIGGFVSTGDEGFTIGVWPLASLAFVCLVSVLGAYLLERRHPQRSGGMRAGAAAAAGGAFAVLMLLVAAPGVRFDASGAAATVSALGPALVPISFTSVFASGWLGRYLATRKPPEIAPTGRPRGPLARELASLAADLGIYAGALALTGAVLGTITLVLVFLQAGAMSAQLPMLLAGAPHAAFWALILAHLGAVTVAAPYTAAEGISVLSPELPFAWFSVLPVVLASLGSALVIGVGRARTRTPELARIWRLPAAVFVVWMLGSLVFLPVTVSGSATVLGFTLGELELAARPAFWTPALFAVWALAVELGAWALPDRASALTPRVHALATRIRTRLGGFESPASAAWAGTAPAAVPSPSAHQASPLLEPARDAAGLPSLPMTARAKRRLRIAGVCITIAVLVVTGSAIAITSVNTQRGAVAKVRAYVEAIAAGDATHAGELVDPNVETSQRDYVSDAMLASASERITVLDVVETELSPAAPSTSWFEDPAQEEQGSGRERRNVQVTYRLGGTTESTVLVAERTENEFLLLETWRVVTPLVFESVAGTSHAMDFTIGSVAATPGRVETLTWEGSQPVSWVPFSAYPAIYPVTGTESTFYSVASEPVRVGPVQDEHVPERNLIYTPTDALTEAVDAAVTAKIDQCVLSTDASPDGCPFSTYVSGANTALSWQVTSAPTVSVSETSDRFEVEDGLVSYSYTGSSGRTSAGSSPIRTTGTFTIVGDTVAIEFS
ncbi:hypothetical protein [Pseudoclavibacter sp. RFBA6]|uniref:hypothetical protein n=1 Tax=Pseudoclavibacter sp. RFBA6 TaxID=2080573 RepID=UPI000CE8DDE3|nr:hypothetical protein [Pseudoclavibacter sp. RFBA6]PPG39329.1 hypothetical protein C5C17_11045 [Pseudoclavibacter sp. RFBA6]